MDNKCLALTKKGERCKKLKKKGDYCSQHACIIPVLTAKMKQVEKLETRIVIPPPYRKKPEGHVPIWSEGYAFMVDFNWEPYVEHYIPNVQRDIEMHPPSREVMNTIPLNSDVFMQVCIRLDYESCCNLARTCKSARDLYYGNDNKYWKKLCEGRYNKNEGRTWRETFMYQIKFPLRLKLDRCLKIAGLSGYGKSASPSVYKCLYDIIKSVSYDSYPYMDMTPHDVLSFVFLEIENEDLLEEQNYPVEDPMCRLICSRYSGISKSSDNPLCVLTPKSIEYIGYFHLYDEDFKFESDLEQLAKSVNMSHDYRLHLNTLQLTLMHIYGQLDDDDRTGYSSLGHDAITICRRIMDYEGRPHICPDDCYPCVSCLPVSPVSQIIANIINLGGTKETYDDIIRDCKNTYVVDPKKKKAICLLTYLEMLDSEKNIKRGE
jgi:hypothetical protein